MTEGARCPGDLSCSAPPWYYLVILHGVKTAISIPDDVLAHLDAVARQAGMSRSEFFRTAGLAYAEHLAATGVTAAIDAHLTATGAVDDGAFVAHSRRRLAEATAEDDW